MERGGHDASGGSRERARRPYGAKVALCNALRLAALCLLLSGLATARASVRLHVPVILAFGDSLTAGFGLPAKDSFPAQLAGKLARDGIAARVVNGGISGDTTADGVSRVAWALAEKPDLVILELGANDMLRGIPPKLVRANLEKIIEKIKASGAKLLLAGMLAAPNWGKAYDRAFDAIYPDLSQAYHVPLYPFFLAGVALKPRLTQADGMHPNKKGVAIIVDRIAPYIVRLLGGKA